MTIDNEARSIFDAWPTTFEPPTRRIVDSPMSVNVDVALAIEGLEAAALRVWTTNDAAGK